MKTKSKKLKRGSVLIGSAIVVVIMTFVISNYLVFVSSGSIGVKRMNDSSKAFYLAEAGLQWKLWDINNGSSNTLPSLLTAVSCSPTISNNTITSSATVGDNRRAVSVDISPSFKAAITVHSNVSSTGNITIDGNDHTITGDLTGEPGVYGFITTGTVSQGGSSTIGGQGYAPANPANAQSYQENAPATSTLPWDVLGVTQAWFNANIPSHGTPPAENNNGMYWYDPGADNSWNGVNFGVSSGILIVHNSTNNATMKNLHGTFVGLIIADQIEHINGDARIIGAVVTTTQAGNAIGNGNAEVLYSSAALNAVGSAYNVPWKKQIKSGTWRESP